MRFLSPRALFKLYDSLVRPVLTYGCQVWLPATKFCKALLVNSSHTRLLQQTAQDPCERAHLQMLKWTLGIHKRSSNVATWGETGRHPVCLEVLEQVLKYKRRLEDNDDTNILIYHALKEQKQLSLSWYTTLTELETRFSPVDFASTSNSLSKAPPSAVKHKLKQYFTEKWFESLNGQPKLRFYNLVKSSFTFESYLDMNNSKGRQALTRLRTSSHNLNIETGRYINAEDQRLRQCSFCSKTLGLAVNEDEHHFLVVCPLYNAERANLHNDNFSILLRRDDYQLNYLNFDQNLATYTSKCFLRRKTWLDSPKARG